MLNRREMGQAMKSALMTATMTVAALLLSGCVAQNVYLIEDVLDARAVSDHGLDLFVTGDVEAAIAAFDSVIDFGSVDGRDYARRAAAYGTMEKYDVALKDAERALQLSPREWRTHLQRAVFHQRTHQFDEAIADLDRALEINSTEIELLRRRAYLKILAGRYSDAIADYNGLSRAMPGSDTGILGRGVALYLAGEWDSAANAFADILDGSPYDGLAALWLAKSTLRAPRPIGWGEFANNVGPEREWTMAKLLVIATDQNAVEDAMISLYGAERNSKPDACERVLFLGTWRLIRRGGDGAERAFKAARQACPVDSIEGAEARAELDRLVGGAR